MSADCVLPGGCTLSAMQIFLTFTVCGSLAVRAGLLTLLLPETLGACMLETIEVRGVCGRCRLCSHSATAATAAATTCH